MREGPFTDEERALLDHLLRSHHQWNPNKKADLWVSNACHLLRRADELLASPEKEPTDG